MESLASTLVLCLAQGEPAPVERLDPATRGAAFLALFALVLLGLVLIVCVMIGGRWMRRVARERAPTRQAPKRAQPDAGLLATDPASDLTRPENYKTGETIVDPPPEDTVAD